MPADWATLRAYADDQADLLTRGQCLRAGVTDEVIEHRLRTRRWRRVHPGVYLTAVGRADWLVRAMAAFLRAGPGAAFTGECAALLWGLRRDPPPRIELAVPATRNPTSPGDAVRIRRRHRLDSVVDDLAYPWRTTVPVTVLDVAAGLGADAALAVVARAVQGERVGVGQLRAELARRGRHRHGPLLREVLGDVADGAHSVAEIRYVRDVERAHGLPVAERQAPSAAGARRLHDNRYAAYGLVVEVDGRLGHESWADRVRDGRRDRQVLPTHGVTLRVFWPDVVLTPCTTAVEVAAVLAARGWRDRARPCRRRGCVAGPRTGRRTSPA